MQRVLVFAPHPDDDVIGCGGSLLNHIQKGDHVEVVYITSGDTGSLTASPEETGSIREIEAAKAAKLLGISQTRFFRNPDGGVNYTKDNIMRITGVLRESRPHIVYLPHRQDGHRDHRITHELVMDACLWATSKMLPECGQHLWDVGTILCYEVGTPLQEVQYVEDITAVMEKKIAAMRLHESQMANLQYDEAVKNLNRLRGIMSGRGEYCECFQIMKVSGLF